jgi:hypothetical protein
MTPDRIGMDKPRVAYVMVAPPAWVHRPTHAAFPLKIGHITPESLRELQPKAHQKAFQLSDPSGIR